MIFLAKILDCFTGIFYIQAMLKIVAPPDCLKYKTSQTPAPLSSRLSKKMAILVFVVIPIFTGCFQNQTEYKHILLIEDSRQSPEKIIHYLNHEEPKVKVRALETFGRFQDSTWVAAIAPLLDDINHNVRIACAFSLGQIGGLEAEKALLERLRYKDLVEVKSRIIEALGKIGGSNTFSTLQDYFTDLKRQLRGEAALSVGRMAYRGIRDSVLTATLSPLLQDPWAEVRWKACYALMRIGSNLSAEQLREAVNDIDPRVRMSALLALGNIEDHTFITPISYALTHDPDWRVRVNAAKAFSKYPLRLTANYLSLVNQTAPVRLAIIEAIGKGALLETNRYRANSRELNYAKNQLEEALLEKENSPYSISQRGYALIAYARLMNTNGSAAIQKFLQHDALPLKLRAIQALGEIGTRNELKILQNQFIDSSATPIKIAILQALGNMTQVNTIPLYLRALNDGDPVVVAIASESIARDTLKNKIHAKKILLAAERVVDDLDGETALTIFDSFLRLKYQKAVPFLQKVIKKHDRAVVVAAHLALTALSKEEHELPQAETTILPDYRAIENLHGAYAIITTSIGQIKIKLFSEEAPLTVSNFCKLASDGFYNGLNFHRVVPNFVIQGGDPRSDGWGSPGYSIRSEFNKINYLRGVVGMASAGKDTEGCQFFITHSPQPHLDGRYTVFGKVVSGMQIVDSIQEGHIIENIRINL